MVLPQTAKDRHAASTHPVAKRVGQRSNEIATATACPAGRCAAITLPRSVPTSAKSLSG